MKNCCPVRSKQDIPASDSFASPTKKGFLLKLVGRGWLYSGSWKNRYCVLDGSKFYFYENEQSKGSEKSSGVINLDYYDVCEENSSKDKKNPHVFVVGTSVRGFFDNPHQFAAESADEMRAWIQAMHGAIAEARLSRRKPGRKRHSEGKSPDLSSSSQESEGTSTVCLVNATKDRAKGPQGRRLPQRKSMMPQTRSAEDNDLRQRSISLSSPHDDNRDEEPCPRSSSDSKWLSVSMDEMDREKEDPINQRSSSSFDIPQKETSLSQIENGDLPKSVHRKVHPRLNNLLGQHAAVTKELEMKLKAGMTPGGVRRPPVEERNDEFEPDKKIECLTARVDLAKDTLQVLEERVSLLTSRVEATNERSEKAKSEVGDVLLQMTVTLKEAERINEECKRALTEVNRARTEYQLLVKECKETLSKLHGETELQQQGT